MVMDVQIQMQCNKWLVNGRPNGNIFGGKVALIPCAEGCVTRRRPRFGPIGSLIQINKNVDAAFYAEMWREEGGGLDQIESCGAWPKGSRVTMQRDGAKAHTEGL